MKLKPKYKVGTFVILSNGQVAHIEETEIDEVRGEEVIGYHGTYKDGAEIYFYESSVYVSCESKPEAVLGGS